MKKIKLRNIIFALIALIAILALAFFGFGRHKMSSLLGVYDVEKSYMYEPPEADITILDFSQYDCDICRIVHPTLKDAMAQDGKVRYIPRPVASCDEWGNEVVQAVYAAALQDKYIQMHNAIYDNWPIENLDELLSVAVHLGLDTSQLQSDMESEEVKRIIQETADYYDAWDLPYVPAFLIDEKILYMPNEQDMPTVDTWKEKFKKVRK